MPYINKKARIEIDANLREPSTNGELAYVLFKTAVEKWFKKRNFDTIVEIFSELDKKKPELGAVVDCVKFEFYLRYAYPYEITKKMQNGDVI